MAAKLPPAWKIQVEVLNGGGDINWTRQVASKIGAMAYTIDRVGRADRFDYQETAVYFEPGGRDVAVRLARQLGVETRPLPGGTDPAPPAGDRGPAARTRPLAWGNPWFPHEPPPSPSGFEFRQRGLSGG